MAVNTNIHLDILTITKDKEKIKFVNNLLITVT
jgi:hypothetical protein